MLVWNAMTEQAGLFITGADTGVGKTHVAAMIARQLTQHGVRVGVYKPVASGCELQAGEMISDDALVLWEAAGRPEDLSRVCPQRFAAPLAPHLAARLERRTVDAGLLSKGLAFWRERSDFVIVEGAGGLMSPLSDDVYVADLAAELGYPLLVVVRDTLGAINQTLQTLIVASTYCEGIPVAGVVLNRTTATADQSANSNADELRRRAVPPLLATIAWQQTQFDPPIDWLRVGAQA